MRENQEFVWGPDLKVGLHQINEALKSLPESTRKEGVFSFANEPPVVKHNIVAELWERLFRKMRESAPAPLAGALCEVSPPPTIEEIHRLANARPLRPDEIDFDPQDVKKVVINRRISRRISRRKGSWVQLPENLQG